MSDNVRNSGSVNRTSSGNVDPSFTALLDALRSGDMDAAANAVGTLLRGRGGQVQGSPKDKGFWAGVKQAFTDVRDRLTGPERRAVTEAIAKGEAASTNATVTDANGEPRPAADANTMGAARRHAIIAERARRSALEQRVDVENMASYATRWDPQVAQAAIEKLDTAQATLEVERQNVRGAMTEIRRDISALEAKPKRSEAESLLLEGKRGQLQAFEGLDQVLGARIDQMAKSKGALKHDNFGNETSKFEVSDNEAIALAEHGMSVDKAAVAVAQVGMQADSNVLRATKLLERQGGTTEAPRTGGPDPAPTGTTTGTGNTNGTTGATTTAAAEVKKPLSKEEVDRAVSNIALGVGTDKTKINSASAIFKELDGKTPEQINQIRDAYNAKYSKAGRDANGSWEGGWDFDKNVRGNMHTWNKQAFDALQAGKPEARQLIADGAKKDQEVNAGTLKADFSEPAAAVDTKGLLSKEELDKAVTGIAMGVGTDKSKINSASAIFAQLEGKTPEQINQIRDAYNAKYGKPGKDANGSWEGGWDFDKNVRGNMHTWNKQAFDALQAGRPEAKQLIADGAKKDQEVNAGTVKADFSEPKVQKPVVTVKEGDWLSRIAANAKNKDGTPVTLEQLRAQPENKYLFERNERGDLIRPGDKVTLPEGATHPAATTDGTVPAPTTPDATRTERSPRGPRRGIERPEVKPETTTTTAPDGSTGGTTEVKPNETQFARLSERQVNDAVAAVANGVGANKGEMGDVNKVFAALDGMSPNQIAQVKEAYNKKFGAQGWDFDKHVTGAMYPWNQRAMALLEKGDAAGFKTARAEGAKLDAQAARTARELGTAMIGMGTDEAAVMQALKNVPNAEMMKVVEREYQRQHGGSLRDALKGDLEGADLERANAYVDGKKDLGSAILLKDIADGGNVSRMRTVLGEVAANRRAAVGKEFKAKYGSTVAEFVDAMLTGPAARTMSTSDRVALQKLAKEFGG